MIAVRGATTIERDTPKEIREATVELFKELLVRNNIKVEKIISILFSATKDIKSAYPGRFIREDLGITDIPILHFQEMDVKGALPLCIRMMIHYDDMEKLMPVYLRRAMVLRPDLIK
jgi:chorismate mutase